LISRLLFISLLCIAPFSLSSAAELQLQLGSQRQTLNSNQLLAHPQARNISIPNDVSYKRSMHYRAIPLSALLKDVEPGDHLQLLASDGFAVELSAAPALSQSGSQAWLAIEDPTQPWPPLGEGKSSAGPFYLVWQNPAASQIGPEQWPYQLSTIRTLAPVAARFPQLLPSVDASPAVQAGFAQYQKNCMACHRLNGAGDSQLGPDLNIPYNPTEYFSGNFLTRYIRNPQSMRRWPQGKMPEFSVEILSDQDLAQLIDYLRHMAGRKVKL
jgi:mono/diheme cytochrome c family protein